VGDPIQAFHFPPRIAPADGQLRKQTDYPTYVRQLVRQVLLTAPGERVNRPDFGAGLKRLVFAASSQTTATLLETTVREALGRWLGHLITVDVIESSFDDGTLRVNVTYTLRARGDQEFLNLEVI
jgi:phage baseplate assembly protein W